MEKKSILIIGPIVDFGGREIMTNLLFHSLNDVYSPNVFSTVSMTDKSVALKGLNKFQWDNLQRVIYNSNLFLKLSAILTKAIYKRKEPVYFFVKNKLSKPFFNFETLKVKFIKQFLEQADFIIYSDEINGKWLKHIIEVSEKEEIPLLLRLTGKIKSVPSFLIDKTYDFNILAHSKQNANAIKERLCYKVWNIDQTSALENELLNLQINEKDKLIYGFLGRFSKEKGVNELIEVFSKNQKNLVIAGNGPFLNNVLNFTIKNKNSSYLGELSPKELPAFFNKIDVFIIPSFEEGGPIVGIEAMASGKLIVSTKVGAMPERMEDTGNDFWFSHEIDYDLQNVIHRVEHLSKTQRLEIRQQVRNKYVSYNSVKVIKKQYLDLIETLID